MTTQPTLLHYHKVPVHSSLSLFPYCFIEDAAVMREKLVWLEFKEFSGKGAMDRYWVSCNYDGALCVHRWALIHCTWKNLTDIHDINLDHA